MADELAEAMELICGQPTVPVPIACRAIGISACSGYQAIKRGDFPAPVIAVGRRYVVLSAGLRRLLDLDSEAS